MDSAGKWRNLPLLAALVALVALPVAIAGASGAGKGAGSSAAKPGQRIATLTKRVRALEEVAERQLAALEGRGGPGKPDRPAGGDLSGFYPNPLIAADAVRSGTIQAGAVGSEEIADDAVGISEMAANSVASGKILDGGVLGSDLGPDAVGSAAIPAAGIEAVDLGPDSAAAGQLGPVQAVVGEGTDLLSNHSGFASVTCPPGMRLIGGGFEWESNQSGTAIVSSRPTQPSSTWRVLGRVEAGAPANTLFAEALCLRL